MPDSPEDVLGLVRRTPLSFLGTVTRVGDTRLAEVPAGERTAVVKVDTVLHAPDAFTKLGGSEVTIQLSDDLDPLAVGDAAAFFTDGMAYGEGLAVREVGRLPADAVAPNVSRVARTADAMPFSALERDIEDEGLVTHADEANAVVIAVVVGLEQAGSGRAPDERFSEHAPDWWRAQLDVSHVEQGELAPGRITVLYPNSRDFQWYQAPKPQPSQEGMWMLHATEGALAEWAPFQILHPGDYQPVQKLQTLQAARR
ncbi:hypothetical protein [Streptomyces sp. NPDC012616]|uniref:hypothetical protein n=1 Tax=Streptomyces sp. NPDC012616 TaxID=3364840 RepID=UPI0036E5C0D7